MPIVRLTALTIPEYIKDMPEISITILRAFQYIGAARSYYLYLQSNY